MWSKQSRTHNIGFKLPHGDDLNLNHVEPVQQFPHRVMLRGEQILWTSYSFQCFSWRGLTPETSRFHWISGFHLARILVLLMVFRFAPLAGARSSSITTASCWFHVKASRIVGCHPICPPNLTCFPFDPLGRGGLPI